MNPFTRFMRKLSVLLGRRRFLNELDEEMAFHRAQAAQEFLADGMTPEAARQAAMRQFGNVTRLREQSHEAVTFRMETVVQDLRFASRQMLRSPGFAITAVLTLTLGITANVIVFGVLQALVLRPIDVPEADKVMSLVPRGNGTNFSYPEFRDIRDDNSVFSAIPRALPKSPCSHGRRGRTTSTVTLASSARLFTLTSFPTRSSVSLLKVF